MTQLAHRTPSAFKHPGELFRYKRRQLGLSQQEVANDVQMSASGLSKVESGKHFIPRKGYQLCKKLNINIDQFIELSSRVPNIQKKPIITTLDDLKQNVPNWRDILKEGLKEMIA